MVLTIFLYKQFMHYTHIKVCPHTQGLGRPSQQHDDQVCPTFFLGLIPFTLGEFEAKM